VVQSWSTPQLPAHSTFLPTAHPTSYILHPTSYILQCALVQVCVTPNLQMGVTMGATTMGMWFVFAGFLIQRPYMPQWWKWFGYLCPPAWSIYAIVVDQLGDKVRLLCRFV
jgi:ABC-type multidrug transport system permease subunit